MVNYAEGKIYKIVNNIDDKCYVGSTTKKYLSQRMDKHRSDYRRFLNKKEYKETRSFRLFDEYGVDNCSIILLEKVNASCKEELIVRERHWIEKSNCVNMVIPGRTIQEYNKLYRETHKDEIRERKKNYRVKYKDQIRDHRSRPFVCVCGSKCWFNDKARHFRAKKHEPYQQYIDYCKKHDPLVYSAIQIHLSILNR
jgi:hypothetical protein